MHERGLFLTFEGSEGCGKSTQIAHLARALEKAKIPTLVTREPGGTTIGETIRHLLKHAPDGHAMTPETELLLFAASRSQLVREKILPALAAGQVVICDRFFDSTTVYQGAARQIPASTVAALNTLAADRCRPDVTFLMDMDAAAALSRARTRNAADRIESEPLTFFQTVRSGYLALAAQEPTRFVVLDATSDEATLHGRIISELARRHAVFERIRP